MYTYVYRPENDWNMCRMTKMDIGYDISFERGISMKIYILAHRISMPCIHAVTVDLFGAHTFGYSEVTVILILACIDGT